MTAARKVRPIYDANGSPVVGALSPDSTVTIAFTAASARNVTAFNAEIVRLIATEDCFVKFGGATVAATTSNMFMKANQPEYFSLRDQFIAAIRSTADGSLYATVMI